MKRNNDELDAAMIRYMPYLSEIRTRLFFIISIFLVAWVVGFIFYRQIMSFIMNLFDLKGVNIAFTSPFQFISLAINTGLLMGISATLPIIIFQIFSFLKPALHKKEYRTVLSLLPFSIVLFISGFAFGTFIMRFIISIFSQRTSELNIQNLWDINLFLAQIILTAVMLGVFFQLPVVLTALLKLGALNYAGLVKKRPYAYAIGIIFVVLLPPTDLFSLIFMFLPLAIMFEITLFLNRGLAKKALVENRK